MDYEMPVRSSLFLVRQYLILRCIVIYLPTYVYYSNYIYNTNNLSISVQSVNPRFDNQAID